MNGIIKNILSSIVLTFILLSCIDNGTEDNFELVDFAHIAVNMSNAQDMESYNVLKSEIDLHADTFDAMTEIMGLDKTDDAIETWLSSRPVKAFLNDVDSFAPSQKEIITELIRIFKNAQKEGLNLNYKSFATAIWSRPQSIIFNDSTMFIALNHYLGVNHPAYSTLPHYMLQCKSPENLPYDIVESLVASAYPFQATDSTSVINRLVYEGVITLVKMRLVKSSSLDKALGYDRAQLDFLEKNERDIWHKMASSKMIFDKSENTIQRLVSPAPNTSIISSDIPGRAGRYIGYKIVKSFIDNNGKTKLEDLLKPSFYNRRNPLECSSYNP